MEQNRYKSSMITKLLLWIPDTLSWPTLKGGHTNQWNCLERPGIKAVDTKNAFELSNKELYKAYMGL